MFVKASASSTWICESKLMCLLKWLNKVGEEALDIAELTVATDPEIRALAACFAKYQELLLEHSSLDFFGIQYEALQLL